MVSEEKQTIPAEKKKSIFDTIKDFGVDVTKISEQMGDNEEDEF